MLWECRQAFWSATTGAQSANVHRRGAQAALAPEIEGFTALRDRRIAKYEARLEISRARPAASREPGMRTPDPMTTIVGTYILRCTGHSWLLHPDRHSRPGCLVTEEVESSWARLRVSFSTDQLPDATYNGVDITDLSGEYEGLCFTQQPTPRMRVPPMVGSQEDGTSEDDTLDAGFIPLS